MYGKSLDFRSLRYFQSGTDLGQDPVCGYESCNKLNPEAEFHIHLVPHSHNDPGWLKTVDQVSSKFVSLWVNPGHVEIFGYAIKTKIYSKKLIFHLQILNYSFVSFFSSLLPYLQLYDNKMSSVQTMGQNRH